MNDIRLKRLIYRSWHRGCKETDLVFGPFADAQLSALSPEMVDLYEKLLDEDDADVWAWLTGKAAPEQFQSLILLLQGRPMTDNG